MRHFRLHWGQIEEKRRRKKRTIRERNRKKEEGKEGGRKGREDEDEGRKEDERKGWKGKGMISFASTPPSPFSLFP